MRPILRSPLVLAIAAMSGPALGQVQEGPAVLPLHQQTELSSTLRTMNLAGRGVMGNNCQILEVRSGQRFTLAAAKPSATVTIEAVRDGIGCEFSDEQGAPPRARASATSPAAGQPARLVLDQPGRYSVRLSAPDLPEGEVIGLMTFRPRA